MNNMTVIPPEVAIVIVHIFNPYGMAWRGPAYRIQGGLQSMFHRVFQKSLTFIAQEFGTYGPTKVL
jgi:hypothetical protein